jgi:Peptidase family C25
MDISGYLPTLMISADYLVITDNVAWDAQTVQPKAAHGDLVSAFKKLTDWKNRRGLNTRIVTVTQIVNGAYGDFVTGARDLQEIIRNFLKWAHQNWGVAWVLLGGDVDTIPVRLIAGPALADVYPQSTDPPPDKCSFWTGKFLKMSTKDLV